MVSKDATDVKTYESYALDERHGCECVVIELRCDCDEWVVDWMLLWSARSGRIYIGVYAH